MLDGEFMLGAFIQADSEKASMTIDSPHVVSDHATTAVLEPGECTTALQYRL